SLGGYSGEEMKDIIARLTELTRQASDELTFWLDQREQMIMDNERYNEMIASLVGRAAKLKDAESKQNTKTKRGITRNSFHLKAVGWFLKAADQGSPQAQLKLDVMYYTGQGVPQDCEEVGD
ncbi:hypothetical protein BGX29_008033, partial [Mortierella sp. GBA35]